MEFEDVKRDLASDRDERFIVLGQDAVNIRFGRQISREKSGNLQTFSGKPADNARAARPSPRIRSPALRGKVGVFEF